MFSPAGHRRYRLPKAPQATYQAAGAAQALQVAAESPSASEVASWLLTQE